jgi:hypothetical protein
MNTHRLLDKRMLEVTMPKARKKAYTTVLLVNHDQMSTPSIVSHSPPTIRNYAHGYSQTTIPQRSNITNIHPPLNNPLLPRIRRLPPRPSSITIMKDPLGNLLLLRTQRLPLRPVCQIDNKFHYAPLSVVTDLVSISDPAAGQYPTDYDEEEDPMVAAAIKDSRRYNYSASTPGESSSTAYGM